MYSEKNLYGTISLLHQKQRRVKLSRRNFDCGNPGTSYGPACTEQQFLVLATPLRLLYSRLHLGSVSTNQVFVVENSNIARMRNVIAGRVLGDKVEILQGLNEGETIITSGQINLSDGSKIAPIK